MLAATTIPARQLPQARVLARTLTAQVAEARLIVLVLDDAEGEIGAGEPFEVLRPDQVEIPSFHRWAALCETPEQLAAAVRPWLLRHLLGSTPSLTWLDPSVRVFAPLDDLGRAAQDDRIVLVPRLAAAGAAQELGSGGAFDSGALALAPGAAGAQMLDWWSEAVTGDGRGAPALDGPLLDAVPGAFPEALIVRDPGLMVAHWNLAARPLQRSDGRITAGGEQLRAFNFRGFDPLRPHWLSEESATVPVSADQTLAGLCRTYAEELLEAGHTQDSTRPYGFAHLANGLALDGELRALYAQALAAGADPGNLFEPTGCEAFLDWLEGPAELGGTAGVSRYLGSVYRRRPDLQHAYPQLDGGDGAGLVEWAAVHGANEEPGIAALVGAGRLRAAAAAPASQPAPPTRPLGVNVCGYLRDGRGLGEAARLYLAALEAVGLPVATRIFQAPEPPSGRAFGVDPVTKQVPFAARSTSAEHAVNLTCMNPPELAYFLRNGHTLPPAEYTIGHWAWEASTVPPEWPPVATAMDELWVSSTYVAGILSRAVAPPVVVVPLPVIAPDPGGADPGLDLPDGFTFLFMFDQFSTLERKNPLGTIEAFCKAFDPGEGPQLLIKSFNGDHRPEQLERLRLAAASRSDVHVIDRYLGLAQRDALLAACDCYVSLHRSEGFGLTMAEAMALGKPVIATGYSGNTDFMTPANSYLVGYRMAAVGPGSDIYPEHATWADPDLDQAAALMRAVWERPDEARKRGRRARDELEQLFSLEAVGTLARARLELIAGGERAPGPSVRGARTGRVGRLAKRVLGGRR